MSQQRLSGIWLPNLDTFLEFAVGFYEALGAGHFDKEDFKVGSVSLDLEGLPESLTSVLKTD